MAFFSSHPFTLATVLGVFAGSSYEVNTELMKLYAKEIMSTCPVSYVKNAKLHGELFEDD